MLIRSVRKKTDSLENIKHPLMKNYILFYAFCQTDSINYDLYRAGTGPVPLDTSEAMTGSPLDEDRSCRHSALYSAMLYDQRLPIYGTKLFSLPI